MTASTRPEIGSVAPEFELPAFPKGPISLAQFRGKKNVLLYFYPKDDTPGCTTEACDFRDHSEAFAAAKTVVLGISPDSVAAHEKFAAKYELKFSLLADEDHAVAEQYGVWVEKNMYGKKSMGIQRATFLIDKKGTVVAVWPRVKVDGHAAAVAAALETL